MNKLSIFKRTFFAIISIFTVIVCRAEDNVTKFFSYENETFAGFNMNYRKAELISDSDSCHTVVIYLHGGSGQGNDNTSQMKIQAVADIYNYFHKLQRNVTILIPQAPYGQQWMGNALPAIKALADKYSTNGNADVYIMGGSMGGNGVWNMLSTYPGYFKGAMPVACNTPGKGVEKFLRTKIVTIAGGEDRRRNIGEIRNFVNKIVQHGGSATVHVENSWGHRQTCEKSFTPDRLDLLFE